MKKILVTFLMVFSFLCIAGNSSADLISSSSDTNLAGSTIVDFESETLGQYSSLTIGDLTITGNDYFYLETTFSGDYNSSGVYLGNRQGASNLTFGFATTVSAFGFNIGASNEDWQLNAFDSSDSIIESYTLPQTFSSNAGDFYGIAAAGISYATLVQLTNINDYGTDYILLDNVNYVTSAQVPEPATMLLFGSGLAGLACFRRRFKKS